MVNAIILQGAYGRTYENESDALADWNAGKDFFMREQKCYCSIRDFDLNNEILDYIVYYNTKPQFTVIFPAKKG